MSLAPSALEYAEKFMRKSTIRKTIYTLNIGDYEPRIRELTYPILMMWADKIGANFVEITERKRPGWPVTIEKFQVAEIARERRDEWTLFIDADTLINPEMFDVTEHLYKDTVAHNGKDMAGIRWTYDKYFRRDGRHIGSCTWFVIASDWTVEDLWRLPEASPAETFENIHITIGEHNGGHCQREHLIDDYTLSRNIARFGLKFDTISEICGRLGWKQPDGRGVSPFLWHKYSMSADQKVREMLGVLCTPQNQPAFPMTVQGDIITGPQGPLLKTNRASIYGPPGVIVGPVGVGWGLMDPDDGRAFAKKWSL